MNKVLTAFVFSANVLTVLTQKSTDTRKALWGPEATELESYCSPPEATLGLPAALSTKDGPSCSRPRATEMDLMSPILCAEGPKLSLDLTKCALGDGKGVQSHDSPPPTPVPPSGGARPLRTVSAPCPPQRCRMGTLLHKGSHTKVWILSDRQIQPHRGGARLPMGTRRQGGAASLRSGLHSHPHPRPSRGCTCNVPPQPAISAGPPASTPALLQALAPTHHCWGRTESSWGKPSVPRLKASKPRPGVSFRHRLLSGQHAGVPGTLTSPQSWFHTREAGGTCRLPRLPQWGLGQEPSTLPLIWPVTARGDSGR